MADGPQLAISHDGGEETIFPLADDAVTLGRDPACGVVLDGGFVSRRHATIDRTPEGYTLTDAGSRNGTFVNGMRVEVPRVLRSGDEIAIGDCRIRFVDGALDAGDATIAITSPLVRPVRCDPATRDVWVNGQKVDLQLSLQEFDLLATLAAQYGRPCTVAALGTAVWGAGDTEFLLHRLVQRLSDKLQTVAPSAIHRVAGDGYRLQLDGPGVPAETEEQEAHGTAIILFADIVDSTATTERVGDVAFREKARELDDALRGDVRDCGGRPVEGRLLGDGILAVFTSARDAIAAAMRCAATGERIGLGLHVGLHAGDVIHEKGNVFGGAVNIASRISALAAPGEVIVSSTVRDLARTSAGVEFIDRGAHELKGVGERMTAWQVVSRQGPGVP